MVNTLIYISIFILQLGVKAFGDWWYKKYKKKIISHGLSVAIDGLIYTIAAYFLFCAPIWCSIIFMIGIVWTSGAMRGILYDLIYNWINEHEWNHYGNSAYWGKLMKKAGKWHMAIKFGLVIIGIIFIILGV